MKRRIDVHDDDAGQRLDRLVASHTGLGRRRTAALFESGVVSVNGRRASKGTRAASGDRLELELPPPVAASPDPGAPLDVRLERPELVVVCKPAGQPTAPLHTGERGSLAGALLARYPEMGGIGHDSREPGLLHRLDTQTSGLVVAARDPLSFERLHGALHRGEWVKRYLAVVRDGGIAATGSIEVWLASDRKPRVRVASAGSPGSSERRTRFRVLRRAAGWALLEVEVSRAYRHQIRASLAHVGHPIAGDALYGGPSAECLGARHALHASYAAWAGDEETRGFAVEDRLPPDLEALFDERPG